MNLTVLGAGAWGTALAITFSAYHRVTLWSADAAHVEAMRAARCNQSFFPDFRLPENLNLSADLPAAMHGAELVIVAVPVAALRSVLEKVASLPGSIPLSNSLDETTSHSTRLQTAAAKSLVIPQAGERTNEKGIVKFPGVIWVCKGFEAETSLLPHQVAAEVLPEALPRGVLSGPSFAQEVARGLPAALVLAATDDAYAQHAAQALHHVRLRIYASSDVTGVEVGGAVKNVMAIAAGICDGLGLGHNARAALLTRGLAEITRLGLKLGGRPETLSGLSGMGDLLLTCTGDLSRNRQVGMLLAQQHKLPQILDRLGHVAEGVYTAREVHNLAQRLGVAMPISEAVYRVLYEQLPAADAVEALLNRVPNMEFQ